jgi:hypothetical protein
MRIRDIALAAALLGGCGGSGAPPQPDPFPVPDLSSAVDMATGSQPDLDPSPSPDLLAVGGDLAQSSGDLASLPGDMATTPADMVAPPDLRPCTGGTLQICSGVCTDLSSDPLNCGSCGSSCATGHCTTGVCTN